MLKKKNILKIAQINYKKKKKYISILLLKNSFRTNKRLNILYKHFIKKGKNKGYYILLELIKYSKRNWKYFLKKPYEIILKIILKAKLTIVLKNKRRGSIMYELPRCLSKQQTIRKIYYWFVKITKKRKKKTIKNVIIEISDIKRKGGELLKKHRIMKIIAKKNKPFFYLLRKKKKKKKKIYK